MSWYNKAVECLDADYAEGLLTDKEYSYALSDLRQELEEQFDGEREQRLEEYCGTEMVTITKASYEMLCERDEWLDCLEAAGVDNWQGIEEATRILNGESE